MWPHKAVFYAAMGGGGHFHPDGPIRQPEDIAKRASEGYPVIGIWFGFTAVFGEG